MFILNENILNYNNNSSSNEDLILESSNFIEDYCNVHECLQELYSIIGCYKQLEMLNENFVTDFFKKAKEFFINMWNKIKEWFNDIFKKENEKRDKPTENEKDKLMKAFDDLSKLKFETSDWDYSFTFEKEEKILNDMLSYMYRQQMINIDNEASRNTKIENYNERYAIKKMIGLDCDIVDLPDAIDGLYLKSNKRVVSDLSKEEFCKFYFNDKISDNLKQIQDKITKTYKGEIKIIKEFEEKVKSSDDYEDKDKLLKSAKVSISNMMLIFSCIHIIMKKFIQLDIKRDKELQLLKKQLLKADID